MINPNPPWAHGSRARTPDADNVTFQYDERVTSLKGISFKVPPGKTFALVGSSGGGKTTIMRLVFRFYDVKSGRILIDGLLGA